MPPKGKTGSRDVSGSRSRMGVSSKVSGNSSRRGITTAASGANSQSAQVRVIVNGRDMTPHPLLTPVNRQEPGASGEEEKKDAADKSATADEDASNAGDGDARAASAEPSKAEKPAAEAASPSAGRNEKKPAIDRKASQSALMRMGSQVTDEDEELDEQANRPITVGLRESATETLLAITGFCVAVEAPEKAAIEARNATYQAMVDARATSDKCVFVVVFLRPSVCLKIETRIRGAVETRWWRESPERLSCATPASPSPTARAADSRHACRSLPRPCARLTRRRAGRSLPDRARG